MKHIIPILAAAVAFTSCAKDELLHIDDNSENLEITFQVAPVTKGAGESFASTSVFETNAYYLTSGSRWIDSASEGVEYIHENTVRWENSAWRLEKEHHWPEAGGNLTFYSWTLNRDNLDFNPKSDAEVSIDPIKGVCLNSFDISLDSDLDFMVAKTAQNRTENSSMGNSAVTTQFKHQLSRVRVTARTGEDYTQDKEITINSITFKNIAKQADYQQSSCENGNWSEINQWTVTETGDAVYGNYSSDPQVITATATELAGERTMFIPQTFTEDVEYLQVSYTVKDFFSGIVENVTENISLDSVIAGEGLVNGKLYTINITISLDSVFWDPAVGDWDE